MRRVEVFLLLFSFFVSAVLLGVTINDVSSSSDLYPYVAEMIQNNIMTLDSNGNFNGTLVVTRADLARILSRLLNYVQGRIQPVAQVTQSTRQTSSATNVALSAELSLKIQKIDEAMQKYSDFEAYVTNTASSINELVSEVDQIEMQFNAMQKLVASLTMIKGVPPASMLSKTIERVDNLNTKVETMNYKVSALNTSVEKLNSKINSVSDSSSVTLSKIKADISNLQIRMDSIQNERQKDSKMISDALNKVSLSSSKMNKLSQENEFLKKKVSSLESTLGTVYVFQALEAVAVVAALILWYMSK